MVDIFEKLKRDKDTRHGIWISINFKIVFFIFVLCLWYTLELPHICKSNVYYNICLFNKFNSFSPKIFL